MERVLQTAKRLCEDGRADQMSAAAYEIGSSSRDGNAKVTWAGLSY
jgi:hypothetical protein